MALWLVAQMGGMIHLISKPPSEVADVAPTGTDAGQATNEVSPDAPAQQGGPSTDPSRLGSSLQVSEPEELPSADTASASVPETGAAVDAPEATSEGDAPTVGVVSEAPALSGANVAVPAQPTLDGTPELAEAAPAPAQQVEVELQPEAPEMPSIDTEARPQAVDGAVVVDEPVQPLAPTVEAEPEVAAAPEPEVVEAPEVEVAVEVPEESEVVEAPEEDVAVLQPAPTAPVEQAPAVETESPTVLAPSGDIGNLAPNVRTNRLPTIGGDTSEPEAEAETPEAEIVPQDGPALVVNAEPFENLNDRPIMAILLIDEVVGSRDGAIPEMPFPVSVAIDANHPDAAQAMALNRTAGREVVILAPLPDGATPTDVEVSLAAYLSTMPNAVAIMDTRDAKFQSGRAVATQVTEISGATGHGLITYSRGLNSATQVASRAGVPAKLVFRVFDEDGQDGDAIKRFLDQAAFRAGQQTGVILVGHNRPETIKAVVEWGLGNRAETVALAPVSAALLAK